MVQIPNPMKKLIFNTLMILLFSGISINAIAQQADSTLAQQYEDVVVKSGSYKVYKNIRKTKIEAFWKNINDTIQKQKKQLIQSKAELDQSQKRITELESALKESGSAISKLDNLGESIKSTANTTIPWGLSIVLAAVLIFIIIRNRSSLNEALQYNERYDELFAEFREYKSKSAEKERKLARELQDERNKVEELKSGKH